MRTINVVLVSTLLSLASAAAFATNGVWSSVTVEHVVAESSEEVSPNGTVYFILSGSSSPYASCAMSNRTSVAVDITEPGGIAAMQVLVQAMLTQSTLTSIVGVGNCGVISGIETLGYVEQ